MARELILLALALAACKPGAQATPDAPPPPRKPPPDLSRREIVPAPKDAAFDAFGRSLAIDGDLLAVGAPGQILSHAPGAVYLYRHEADGWKDAAMLVPDKGDPGQRLGVSVAVSGHTLAASGRSFVLVFEETNGRWQKTARLRSPGSENFGQHVALSGDTLAVADDEFDSGSEVWAGAVFVYRRGADGSWADEARLTATPPKRNETLGSALALAGDTLVVGARQASGPADSSGALHVFERNPSGWSEVLVARPTSTETMIFLGDSVAVDRKLVIGGNIRQVLAYQGSAAGWKPAGTLDAPALGNELFAWEVALHDEVAAVTVRPKADSSIPLVPGTSTLDEKALATRKAASASRVLIYQREVDGWYLVDTLTHPDAVAGDDFGRALAFGSRGLVVGAPGIGSVVVFGKN